MVAALGGLLFGFDTAVISGTTGALQEYFGLSEAMLGFTVVTALIGTVLGSIAVSRPADIWGRKRVLIVLAVLYTVSAVGSGLAWNVYAFWFFRLIGGLAVGGASVVSPMYIAEISPAEKRGRLVGWQQFNVCFASAWHTSQTSSWPNALGSRIPYMACLPSGGGCSSWRQFPRSLSSCFSSAFH